MAAPAWKPKTMARRPRKYFFINILCMLLGQRESVLIIAHKRAWLTGSAWDKRKNALLGSARQLRKAETGKKRGSGWAAGLLARSVSGSETGGELAGRVLRRAIREGPARSLPKGFCSLPMETLWLRAVGMRLRAGRPRSPPIPVTRSNRF